MGPTDDATKLSLCCNVGEKKNLSLIWTSWTSGPAYGGRLRGLILRTAYTCLNMVLYPQKTFCCVMLCHDDWLDDDTYVALMRMSTTQSVPMYSFNGRGFTSKGQCLHSVQPCAKYKQGSATSSPYHWLLKNKRSCFYQGKKFPRTAASCEVEYVNWHLEACN